MNGVKKQNKDEILLNRDDRKIWSIVNKLINVSYTVIFPEIYITYFRTVRKWI